MKIIFDSEEQKKIYIEDRSCPNQFNYPVNKDCSNDMEIIPSRCEKCWEDSGIELEVAGASEDIHVAYLCDHKVCKECGEEVCDHTTDIRHAVNFFEVDDGYYMERDEKCLIKQ